MTLYRYYRVQTKPKQGERSGVLEPSAVAISASGFTSSRERSNVSYFDFMSLSVAGEQQRE